MKYNNRFIALDTETGGLISKAKLATIDVALTEIAVVVVENEDLSIIDKQSWLISPYDEKLIYTSDAERVSGISKQMCINEGLDIEFVYKSLAKVLKANKVGSRKPILVMQNKGFDTPFIENMFAIFGDSLDKYIERVEDTLDMARFKWPEKPNYKLGSLAEYAGIDLVAAHRALPDTITTAKIWIHFMKCLRGEGEQTQQEESVTTYRENFKM